MPIHVLIVDPRELVRVGIESACHQRDDLKLVGEACDLEAGLSIAQLHAPDVVVISLNAFGFQYDRCVEAFREATPEKNVRFLLLANEETIQDPNSLVQLGVSGYLTDQASIEEMGVAIRSVASGRVFISHRHPTERRVPPARLQTVAAGENGLFSSDRQTETASPGVCIQDTETMDLSSREREVLGMVADGMTNKQAAEQLFLSVKTVETYRARIMRKFGLKDRVGLVRFARERCSAPSTVPA